MRSSHSASARLIEAPPDQLIRRFQSETDEIRAAPEPIQARLTLFVATGMFLTLLGVSLVFPLDRVVTSEFGQIVTVEPTIVVQALDASIIKTIDVEDGQRVAKGQLIATLDPTFAAADVTSLRLQIASLKAEIGRCEAELAHKPFDMAATNEPESARYVMIQKNYFAQRKAQYEAQLQSYDQQIAQTKATITQLSTDAGHYADRTDLAKQIERMHRQLEADKFDSHLNVLTSTDQDVEMLRNTDYDRNGVIANQHLLASTMANKEAFIKQWEAAVSLELVTARGQLDTAEQALDKAARHKDLVRITAPDKAIVLQLAKLSVGSVLNVGDTLGTLALLRSPVEVEVDIDPHYVGFIRIGDPAVIKLDPYHFIEHGWAEGKVLWISDGTFATDPITGASISSAGSPIPPYYRVRISITKINLTHVPKDFQLLPGTTLTADIHVGTRSAFMYLMRGLLKGLYESMREP